MRATNSLAVGPDTLQDDDAALVRQAVKDPTQFQSLYEKWATPIYQYFYHRTGEMASAEDLTSQLFLRALQALPCYQHRGRFAAWLFAIARNLAREHYRKSDREAPLEMAENLVARSDMATEISQEDEIRRLVGLIRSLPDDEQELIRLRYVANLSFADLAVVLGKHDDAVKKSLYRLQARLQSLLEQNHD